MTTHESNRKHADREIVISRMMNAPRELVYEAWTNKHHIDKWWGPDGFRNETSNMDVRPGGEWSYIMHGPDGKDWDNLISYLEVVKPEKLVYWHGDHEDPKQFYVTVEFIAKGDHTEVIMTSLFPTAEARDFVIREHGAIEGGNQTLGRLSAFLSSNQI